MNRNMKLVHKRQSLIGIFITRKRAKGYTIKKAVEEAALVFSVGIKTTYNDYNKYRTRIKKFTPNLLFLS
tara:strand:- start:1473 stop:1682 length:210 start_codon:yes stop_codon:yes gene_type:complete